MMKLSHPESQGTQSSSRMDLTANIAAAKDYLVKATTHAGRYIYKVNARSKKQMDGYNIVRHAGAIYSLASSLSVGSDAAASAAIQRAIAFLMNNYVASLPGSTAPTMSMTMVVWSQEVCLGFPFSGRAPLGAAGLALVALSAAKLVGVSTLPAVMLEGIGRFVLLMQKADGSFYDQYVTGAGPVMKHRSLYYPGEAIMGLTYLFEVTNDPQWLVAAGKGLAYLVNFRKSMAAVPSDHWAILATARFLPNFATARCTVSESDLVNHVIQIVNAMLSETTLIAGGRTAQIATRMEGLIAALAIIPPTQADLITKVKAMIQAGVAALVRAQLKTGIYTGGLPRTAKVSAAGAVAMASGSASTIRIDYVQHALSAFLAYRATAPSI